MKEPMDTPLTEYPLHGSLRKVSSLYIHSDYLRLRAFGLGVHQKVHRRISLQVQGYRDSRSCCKYVICPCIDAVSGYWSKLPEECRSYYW